MTTVQRRHTTDLTALDPCYSIVRGAARSAVHARHPDVARLTLCGRSLGHELHPRADEPIGCHDCRLTVLIIRDREARGLPRLCLAWARSSWPGSKRVRCAQPVDGHRQRPDLDYPSPWHDGVELLLDDDDEVGDDGTD